jgi:hypothetical protein
VPLELHEDRASPSQNLYDHFGANRERIRERSEKGSREKSFSFKNLSVRLLSVQENNQIIWTDTIVEGFNQAT